MKPAMKPVCLDTPPPPTLMNASIATNNTLDLAPNFKCERQM